MGWKSQTIWIQIQQDLLECPKSRKKVTMGIFLKLKSFWSTKFVIIVLWTSRSHTSFDFFSRSQPVVNDCGNSSFNNKNPTSATQHHYVVSIRSWIKTKNKAGGCDCLHLTISSCSKIPRALTISHVLSSQKWPRYTFTSKPPKTIKNHGYHYNHYWNLRLIHHFPNLVPKMQTLNLLIPSWHSWQNKRWGTRFKKNKSWGTSVLNWVLSESKQTPHFLTSIFGI